MSSGIPTVELLESTHSFPCEYVFKVIGWAEGQFVGRVVHAVRSELREEIEPSFSSRTTAGGRHVCVTIRPLMDEAGQVIKVYQRLQELDGLVMLL